MSMADTSNNVTLIALCSLRVTVAMLHPVLINSTDLSLTLSTSKLQILLSLMVVVLQGVRGC